VGGKTSARTIGYLLSLSEKKWDKESRSKILLLWDALERERGGGEGNKEGERGVIMPEEEKGKLGALSRTVLQHCLLLHQSGGWEGSLTEHREKASEEKNERRVGEKKRGTTPSPPQ